MDLNSILRQYEEIKAHQRNLMMSDLSMSLSNLASSCLELLETYEVLNLSSQVPDKNYFSWVSENGRKKSRPINAALFENLTSAAEKKDAFFSALQNNDFANISAHDITRGCYVTAISFCAVIDLLKERDQKTPGTFFEYLIGHCYARKLGMDPRDRVDVLNLGDTTSLPTDFIFDLGLNRPKFHLPVKTSTRERVIQVWAHQRVLDGVYGTGRFWGTLVALAETKLDITRNIVTDICLPDQWKLYQLFIAQMKRIYYLDLPQKYSDLNNFFPKIPVKEFGEFFHEVDDLNSF